MDEYEICENTGLKTPLTGENCKRQSDGDRRDMIKDIECPCKGQNSFLCNPLLAYVGSAFMRANKQSIKRVVLGHFTPQAIHAAKNELWLNFPSRIIGDQKVRKGSTLKPKQEFEVEDIVDAISTLDAEGIPLCLHVSAYDCT